MYVVENAQGTVRYLWYVFYFYAAAKRRTLMYIKIMVLVMTANRRLSAEE